MLLVHLVATLLGLGILLYVEQQVWRGIARVGRALARDIGG